MILDLRVFWTAMNRSKFLRTAAGLAVLALLSPTHASAAKKTAKPVTTKQVATTLPPTSSPSTTAAPLPVRNDATVTLGYASDATSLADAATFPSNVANQQPAAVVYDTLLRMTEDYKVIPGLAERWELIEPNTFRFFLRKGVKFHDGSEFTAKDVVFSMDRWAKVGGGGLNAAPNGTVAVSDYVVDFTPFRTNKKIPLQVVHPQFAIMKAGSDVVKVPMGTGPFKFVSYAPRETLVLERNDNYWDRTRIPAAKRLVIKYLPDPNARIAALRAGDIDVAALIPRESVGTLKADKTLKVAVSARGSHELLLLNVNGSGKFDLAQDDTVRQAVALSIDRKAIVEQLWDGNAELTNAYVPPGLLGPGGTAIKGSGFDPDLAQKILVRAGWKPGSNGIRERNGRKLELTVISGFPDAESHRPIPEALQQMFRKVGIDLKIVETPSSAAYAETLRLGAGDMFLERFSQNDANPAFHTNLIFVSTSIGNPNSNYNRAFGVAGSTLDRLMLQQRETGDIAATQRMTIEAMRSVVDDQNIVVPIAGLGNFWAWKTDVSGVDPHPAFVHTDLTKINKR